jgi:predicted secreted protein
MRFVTGGRRSAVILAGALLTLVMLPAAAGAAGVAVSDADNGKTVLVVPNTTVTITLESNASTGYSWEVVTAPDPAIAGLLPGAGKYTAPAPPASGPPVTGAPGKQTFAFRSHALGTTKIVLGYIPPAATTPANTFTLDIRVLNAADLPNTATSPQSRTAMPPYGLLVGLVAAIAAMMRLLPRRSDR